MCTRERKNVRSNRLHLVLEEGEQLLRDFFARPGDGRPLRRDAALERPRLFTRSELAGETPRNPLFFC